MNHAIFLRSQQSLPDPVQKVLAFLQPLCHFEHLCSGLHTVHAQARFEQVSDAVQRFQAGGIHREFILRQHMRYRATFACARIASSLRSRKEQNTTTGCSAIIMTTKPLTKSIFCCGSRSCESSETGQSRGKHGDTAVLFSALSIDQAHRTRKEQARVFLLTLR